MTMAIQQLIMNLNPCMDLLFLLMQVTHNLMLYPMLNNCLRQKLFSLKFINFKKKEKIKDWMMKNPEKGQIQNLLSERLKLHFQIMKINWLDYQIARKRKAILLPKNLSILLIHLYLNQLINQFSKFKKNPEGKL